VKRGVLFLLAAGAAALALRFGADAAATAFLAGALGRALVVPFRTGEVRLNILDPSVKVSPLVLFRGEQGEEFLRVDAARAFLRVGPSSVEIAGAALSALPSGTGGSCGKGSRLGDCA